MAAILTLSGCGATKADAPEPSPSDILNGTHTQVIKMPEGFRNIAVTCDGSTAIYVTSRGWVEGSANKNITALPSDVAVVPNSPRCVK